MTSDRVDFYLLCRKVAKTLTGKDLEIFFRKQKGKGVRGHAAKTLFFKVEIDPDLEGDDFLETFCHECSHVLLHSETLNKSVSPKYYQQRENEADSQAATWLDTSIKLCGDGASIWEKLEALHDFYSEFYSGRD